MTTNPASISWKQLIHVLDAYVAAWDESSPPDMTPFLPPPGDSQRLPTLIELIKVDLEYRWTQNIGGGRLEDYAERFPELAPEGNFPLDLVYEEFHVRRQAGDAVAPADYLRRFPAQAIEIASLLQFESPDATTSIHKRGGCEQFEAGQMIDDFDLLLPLGEGAFAQVFLARQISMQRLVALKISAARGEEHKTLAQLDHPYIVRVFSQTMLAQRGVRLLYMQYHAGGTLKELIDAIRKLPEGERNGRAFLRILDRALEERGVAIPFDSLQRRELERFDWPRVVCWLGQRIAAALDYAHGKDVLHRDLKPANILLDSDASPKLADFNISFCKQVAGASPVAYFGGSLAYMSPEQLAACDPTRTARPEDLDARSDLYALGVVLWELLAGARPFADLSWGLQGSQLLGEMIHDRTRGPDFSKLPAGTPPLLARVLRCCLAARPEDRFSSGAELSRQLEQCLDPEIQEFFDTPRETRRQLMRGFPTWSALILTGIPNLLMSVLNILYNYDEVVRLSHADLFKIQVGMLNLLAYGSGFFLIGVVIAPVRRAFSERGNADARRAPPVRKRILQLPYWVAAISLVEWMLCGILFPLGLHLATGEAVLQDYLHFFVSHAINGTLAAAGAFFLVSRFSLRELLAEALDTDQPDPTTGWQLRHLETAVSICLGIVVCLPLLAVALAVVFTGGRGAFAILAGMGLVGVGLASIWSKRLRRDVSIVSRIVR